MMSGIITPITRSPNRYMGVLEHIGHRSVCHKGLSVLYLLTNDSNELTHLFIRFKIAGDIDQ